MIPNVRLANFHKMPWDITNIKWIKLLYVDTVIRCRVTLYFSLREIMFPERTREVMRKKCQAG